MHKSGFVNIIGRPNVGKSTLMNTLVGERMSIITHKPQTTRHRIIGIVSAENYQIVFSDTPGIIYDPNYRMQEVMNKFVHGTFEDGDIMILVTDMLEIYEADNPLFERLQQIDVPKFLLINKIDLAKPIEIAQKIQWWMKKLDFSEIFPISALKRHNTDKLLEYIVKYLPEGPVYYPKDQLTDKSERFFVSEIIREKILMLYKQEIPYSCEVTVNAFKVDKKKQLVRISATIFVMRKTQLAILIGKDGTAIKRLSTHARRGIEQFLEQKVFLDLSIKVKDNWRDDERLLKNFGYEQ